MEKIRFRIDNPNAEGGPEVAEDEASGLVMFPHFGHNVFGAYIVGSLSARRAGVTLASAAVNGDGNGFFRRMLQAAITETLRAISTGEKAASLTEEEAWVWRQLRGAEEGGGRDE